MYRFFAVALLHLMIATSSVQAQTTVLAERMNIEDPQGLPLEIGIWSPRGDASGLPLIVMSHGTGGDFRSHMDTAQALADNGFVVAAVTHTGDNWRDQSKAPLVWERSRHLKLLTDYMLAGWSSRARIDPSRIGAFGFSAGGFTVLVAAGGKPDLRRVRDHCRLHPQVFECRMLSAAPPQKASLSNVIWTVDPRVRAAVVAAPALGYTFSSVGLQQLRIPVQLWRASDDEILPAPFYAEAVRDALPQTPEYRNVANAGHFDFLSPCPPAVAKLRAQICSSRSGFDRVAFHAKFNAAVVAFFSRQLRRPPRR